MSSDDDDFAAILNLPPVEVKTALKKEIYIMVIMSDEEEVMHNRCEVVDTVTEIDMTQDAKDKTEGHGKVPIEIDKIVIKRPINKEKPDQGELYETITCRTCFATEIEGEVLAFNTNTRMVIIKPTPILGQPLRNGMHMVNLDFVKDIRIMRVCTNKPPEPTIFDIERLHTSVTEGVEKEQDLFTKEERWSGDDKDAPGELFGTTNTVHTASLHQRPGEIAPLDASYPTMRVLSDSKM
jgi:hypothetical protein